jgi:hypothetical protein
VRPPSWCMRLWRLCNLRRWVRCRIYPCCVSVMLVQGTVCNHVLSRGLICNLVV